MTKKVYIVRYGEYSDQGIACVFSNKKQAETYCVIKNELDTWNHYWIDDRILNEEAFPKEVKIVDVWEASIRKATGDLEVDEEPRKEIFEQEVKITGINDDYAYIIAESTISPRHAKKVAIEQYQKYTQQKLENGEMKSGRK